MNKLVAAIALACASFASSACVPSDLAGAGTRMQVEANAAGIAVAWWCPGLTDPKLSLYAARWPALTADLRSRLAAIGASSDKLAAIEEVRAASSTTPLADLRDVWSPLLLPLAESRPSPSRWAVARNASYPTRPSYPVIDGARAAVSTGRADVGASCDCRSAAFVEGQSTYCAVAPAVVALCARIP